MGKQLSPLATSRADQSPYLRVANVFEDRIDYSDVKSMHFSPAEREVLGLKPGDILLNEGQGSIALLGSSALYEDPGMEHYFQNTLIRFRPGPELDGAYAQEIFKQWRRTGEFARVARGTSIAHLGADRFASMQFPWIPLPKQRDVVARLEVLDSSAALAAAELHKTEQLRQAIVNSQVARLPHDSRLADNLLVAPQSGYSPREVPSRTGNYVLGLGCLTPSGFSPAHVKNAPTSIAQRPELLRENDLLISRANGSRALVGLVGRYRDVGGPCIYPDLMMRLRLRSNLNPAYAEEVLRAPTVRAQILTEARGTSGILKITSSIVSNLMIPVPTPEVQQHVVDLLGAPSMKVAALRAEIHRLAELRKALLDVLLPHPLSMHSIKEPAIIGA
ncbi:hypothetical protein [Catenulispora pinisilvae]|uniref:hypothetical protein n=1 Tax=Catenulispora pinisilvae TaxID=2705253 RepID=UPI001891DBF3|nr:hypothetical protein [Catenulispora pinisilvae]